MCKIPISLQALLIGGDYEYNNNKEDYYMVNSNSHIIDSFFIVNDAGLKIKIFEMKRFVDGVSDITFYTSESTGEEVHILENGIFMFSNSKDKFHRI